MDRKRNRGSALVGVIFALVLIGIGVGVFLFIRAKKFDPGTVEDSRTYKNKWADVKITVPEGYAVTTKEDGDTKMVAFSKDTSILVLCADNSETDLDAGLEEVRQVLMQTGSQVTSAYPGVGLTVRDTTTKMIAGKSYKVLPIEMKAGTYTAYYNLYGRVAHGNGVFIIAAFGTSKSDIDNLIGMIEEY